MLTENVDRVIKTAMNFFAYLRDNIPIKAIHKDYFSTEARKFLTSFHSFNVSPKYLNNSIVNYVSINLKMQDPMKREHILSNGSLEKIYDAGLIKKILDLCTVENGIALHSSKTVPSISAETTVTADKEDGSVYVMPLKEIEATKFATINEASNYNFAAPKPNVLLAEPNRFRQYSDEVYIYLLLKNCKEVF